MFSKTLSCLALLLLIMSCNNTRSGYDTSDLPDSLTTDSVTMRSGDKSDSTATVAPHIITNPSSGNGSSGVLVESSGTASDTNRPGGSFGNIAIYCSRKMQEGLEYDVAVVLSKILNREDLRERTAGEISRTSPATLPEAREATDVHRVETARRMKVELKFQEDCFDVIYEPANKEKIIDEKDTTTEWHWTLTPTSLGKQTLIVAVYRYDEEAGKWKEQGKPQRFEIIVKINEATYFSKLWDFVKEKPEWPITTLIIPFVTYLAGLRRGRRKRSEKE